MSLHRTSAHALSGANRALQIVDRLSALRDRLKLIRGGGGRVALVPTMGALHAGHLRLIEIARRHADHVIVSIFVNPRQFGPGEDFEAYPRRAEGDAAQLAEAGVSLLWMPDTDQVYPPGYATTVSVARLGDALCGAARPGHFDGVATVVTKLLNQVRPDLAVFGEKDWQQLAIIRRLVIDLDLGVEIIAAPTMRADDGLALSSRNAYLSPDERRAACALPDGLSVAATALEAGAAVAPTLATLHARLAAAGFGPIDYIALVDPQTLTPLTMLDRPARLLAAARIGGTRLIDNLAVAMPN